MNIAVIPARGGSKRVPRKNVRTFLGKPIIAYSIATALEAGLFARVVVSTDDVEIAEIARAAGAEVPWMRPPHLADDFTGTSSVVAHAISMMRMEHDNIKNVCCIYATAPLMRSEDIRRAYEVLLTDQAEFVFPACPFPAPVQRGFVINAKGTVEMLFPSEYQTRSQDLPVVFYDAGQFYWGLAESWLRQTQVFGSNSRVITIPTWRVHDIDTEEDWRRAEDCAKRGYEEHA